MKRTGRRKHRVMLQRAVDTLDDATGSSATSFTDLGRWTCHKRPLSVREAEIAGGVRDEASVELVGRNNSTVRSLRAKDRAVDRDGTIYNLAGEAMVSDDNRDAVLRVRSGLNAG